IIRHHLLPRILLLSKIALRLALAQLRLERSQRCTIAINERLLDTRIDLNQQFAFFDSLAGLYMNTVYLPRYLGADLYIASRLQRTQGRHVDFYIAAANRHRFKLNN